MFFSPQGTGMQKQEVKRYLIPGVTGKFGLGVQNEVGQRLTEFCQRMHWSQQTPSSNNMRDDSTHDITRWSVPKSDNYIFYSQRWRSNIQSAKTKLGADCGSDHKLLIVKFRLELKKVGKTTRPVRYDLNQIPCNYAVEVTNSFKGFDLIDKVAEE